MNRGLREIGTALLIAATAVVIVLGALSLSLTEGNSPATESSRLTKTVTPQVISPTVTQPTPVISATAITFQATITPFSRMVTESPAGISIYIPTGTTSTSTCGPAPGWVQSYTVQAGDTLYRIATTHYTTVTTLQSANCKGSSTFITAGERLWVPNIATRTPEAGDVYVTPSPFPTDPLTETPLPFTVTPVETTSPNP